MADDLSFDDYVSFITTNKKIIYKVCHAYCKQPSDFDDLVQDILLQLWRSRERYNPQFKLSTWVYRIALNCAISHHRKTSNQQNEPVLFSEDLPEAFVLSASDDPKNENVNVLYQCIRSLNQLDRALILLHLDEFSHQQIADIMGLSVSNVATKLSRIRAKLKELFASHSLHSEEQAYENR